MDLVLIYNFTPTVPVTSSRAQFMSLAPESQPGSGVSPTEHSALCLVKAALPATGSVRAMERGAGLPFTASKLVPATFVVFNKRLLNEK